MNTEFDSLNLVASILIFLAAFPALWIAGQIVLRNLGQQGRPIQLILWFALGGCFLIPLIDLLSYLRDLIGLAVPSGQSGSEFSLFLGRIAWPRYSGMAVALSAILYGLAIYYGGRLFTQTRLMENLTLNPLEKAFIVLGLAGLINQMVRGIVLNFLWIRIPVPTEISSQGLFGALLGWIVGLMLLGVVVAYMNGLIEKKNE